MGERNGAKKGEVSTWSMSEKMEELLKKWNRNLKLQSRNEQLPSSVFYFG